MKRTLPSKRVWHALFVNVVLIFVAALPEPTHGADVAIIQSFNVDASREAVRGFQETIRHRIAGAFDLAESRVRGNELLGEIQSKINVDLIFTVGAPALKVVSQTVQRSPIVYAMVFNPSRFLNPQRKNIAGVSMNVSLLETIQLFRDLSPAIRKIGVLFDPGNSGYVVMQAQMVARPKGIRLVTREIRDAKTVIEGLNSMRGQIDALWLIPDETIFAPEVIEYMVLFSYRNKIPLLGLSENHTDMGAVASLSFASSKDMGKQAGELANSILAGRWPGTVVDIPARQTRLTVNVKAANRLGIEIPHNILDKADNVVKAPVYKEGDWWVFRARDGKGPPREYRVTYKNGQFESDDPSFLTLNERSDYVTWFPKVSVHLNDTERKWLEFPLLGGKKWDFWYQHVGFPYGEFRWVNSEAEVVATSLKAVETPAGRFKAIEVQRIDTERGTPPSMVTQRYADIVTGVAAFTTEHVYFYSPETRSVVQHKAHRIGRRSGEEGGYFEMELVAYGPKEN